MDASANGNALRQLDLSQFHSVFFAEAAEHLETMESLLVQMSPAQPDAEMLNAVFRAAHSIKGSSATFGFRDMAEVTHVLETLLDRARHREMQLSDAIIDTLLAAGDVLRQQLAFYQQGQGDRNELDTLTHAITVRIESLLERGNAVAEDDGFGFFDDGPLESTQSILPAAEGGSQAQPLAGNASPHTTQGEQASQTAAAMPSGVTAGKALAPARTITPTQRNAGQTGDAASIRVGVEKVDQLINLVGELVITQAMLSQTVSRLDPQAAEALGDSMAHLARNTRDLQESVMSVRMMPIAVVFNRFPRMVRDLAAQLGKQVRLQTMGESTELDKGLIEKIADPLTHLVRNSLDHGIEGVEARLAAGKPAQGTVTLRAFHRGGAIVLEVSDDGAGLNREKILAKARERGLAVDEAMTDSEVWQLIFEAGFSTADQVTDISGRGVGMDVVKRNIESMGGSVAIESAAGVGSKVTVRLPLTLAILDGMSVSVGGHVFILPLAHIVESLRPSKGSIRSIAGQGQVIHLRDTYVPVIALDQMFSLPPANDEALAEEAHDLDDVGATGAQVGEGLLVVLDADGAKRALRVDALLGQHQVVIKSLETNYRKVEGVSGATIMGDGMVALILDVPSLVRMSRQ